MKRILQILSTILCLAFILSACSPTGTDTAAKDPKDVVDLYYQSVMDGDFSTAYSVLSKAATENITEDEFALYEELLDEIHELKSFESVEIPDDNTVELGGVTYDFEDIVAYDVTATEYSFYYEKEDTETYTRYVVKENGEWKLYREFTKSDIAWCYWKIGVMYYKGAGKEQSYSEAISYYNKALEVDNTYNEPYYWLALAYDKTEMYDKALQCAEIFVENSTKNNDKSDGLNVIGVVYLHKGDKVTAKSYYKQALELNPENEFANDNLESLE